MKKAGTGLFSKAWLFGSVLAVCGLTGIAAHAATREAVPATSKAETPQPATTHADAPLSVWAFCERAAVATEMAQRLPRAVLFSVAMVESGRFNTETHKTRPWPWTINAEGKSYYFKTKHDAIAMVKTLRKQGVRSIDVGCMQINLRYHPDAFTDLDAAFDPIVNVAYAADFLKRLHARSDSWPEAIAAYHSQTKTRSQPYFARVIDVWADQHTRIAKLAHELREQAVAQVAAQLRHTQEEAVAASAATVAIAQRPAPKVLDTLQTSNIMQVADAGIGLRLSIAEGEFATPQSPFYRPQKPRVIDSAAPEATMTADVTKQGDTRRNRPTVLADASPTF
jgi:hypothetical protein